MPIALGAMPANSHSLQTPLVPHTRNVFQGIENVSAVIEADIAHDGLATGVRELRGLERVVEAPLPLKKPECHATCNSHARANGEFPNV